MERNFTLLTDFYELTMMQGYLKCGKHKEKVIFDMFYRKNPCGNGFAICCGLEQVVEYIRNLNQIYVSVLSVAVYSVIKARKS